MKMKMKMKKWKVDDTTKYFINLKLEEGKQDIIEFRRRWKLGDDGLKDGACYPAWIEKVKRECQNLRRPIRISELEAYFDEPDFPFIRPILSTELEGRLREENYGDNLADVYKMELRGLGVKLRLPAEFDLFLDHFVTYNVPNYDLIFNHGIRTSIRYRMSEDFGLISENICLTLGQNTASPDLDNLWEKEIKPLLKNLIERIKDKERKNTGASILEEMINRGAGEKGWQGTWTDPATNKKLKEVDRDIAVSTMEENKVDKSYQGISSGEEKKINQKIGKKVQNIRHYRFKMRPII